MVEYTEGEDRETEREETEKDDESKIIAPRESRDGKRDRLKEPGKSFEG